MGEPAVETCGIFDPSLLEMAVPVTDLFLWDVKDTDANRHRENTGGSLAQVLSNLRRADALGARTRMRCILLRGVNLNEAHLKTLTDIYHSLRHCEGIELLPYHTYGDSKNLQLGRESCACTDWIPADGDMQEARDFIAREAVLVTG